MKTCNFSPYPGSGAYGHWICDKDRFHFSAHRFINYTIPRVPHFWRVRSLWRSARTTRRLRRIDKPGYTTPYDFRRVLYPATYKPVPVTGRKGQQ